MGAMDYLKPFKKITAWFCNDSRLLFKKEIDKICSELLSHFRTVELDFYNKIKEVKGELTNCFKFAEDARKDLEIKHINQKDDIIRLEKRVESLEKHIAEIKTYLDFHLIKKDSVKEFTKPKGKPGRKPKNKL
jgi:hypothetical protein